jgi:predicted dienelactone hydrolase
MSPSRNLTVLTSLIVVFMACLGCQLRPEHVSDEEPDTFGLWEVGHKSFTAIDAARDNRSLRVDVWYPVDADQAIWGFLATYPLLGPLGLAADIAMIEKPVSTVPDRNLIVFSHGYGGTNTQSTPLMETLASHGFIVVAPEHTGNAQSSPTDSFDQAAENRVPDVSFVIDTMLARNQEPSDCFYERLDELHVGVVGHSFGGMTAIGTAAGWAGAEADPRVAAIAPISAVIDPTLQSEPRDSPYAGFDEEQLSSIGVPVMLMGGTEDTNVPIENNALAFDLIPPPVYKVDIIGATHTHFANVCAIGDWLIHDLHIDMNLWDLIGAGDLTQPYLDTCTGDAFPIAEAIRLQNLYVVAFFKRHLQDLTEYDPYLTVSYAEDNEPDVDFAKK